MAKRIKTNLELMSEIRREWTINPVTRVEPDRKKYSKQSRKDGKRECQTAL